MSTTVNHETGVITETLTAMERSALTHAEATIEHGLNSFLEVGDALAKVRESKLYREDFGTFDAYCSERWGISDSRARQLIGAAQTVTNVTGLGAPAPASEGQARELAGLTPEAAAEVMVEATQAAPKVTATTIRETRERLAAASPPQPPPTPEPTVAPNNGAITWRRTYMAEISRSTRLLVVPPEDVAKNADHALLSEFFRRVDDFNNYADRVRALLPTGLTVIKGDAK